jgi:hypothetical protein
LCRALEAGASRGRFEQSRTAELRPPLRPFACPVTIAQPTAKSGASRATRQIGGGVAASPFRARQKSSPDEASRKINAHFIPVIPEHARALIAGHVSAVAADIGRDLAASTLQVQLTIST